MPMLTIPDATYRQLMIRAEEQHVSVEDLATRLLTENNPRVRFVDQLIDIEYHAECAEDTSPVPSLDEVRSILAKLPNSLSADIIADRDER